MSMNLIHTNRAAPSDAADHWAAITAITATDTGTPFSGEGYVSVSGEAIVALAALLDGAVLANGQKVTTYDFSRSADDNDDGRPYVDAHVESFGPSLLDETQMAAVRAILAPFPTAIALLDVVVERGLQLSLSTDLGGRSIPHMKGVNWIADEVEIRLSSGWMKQMLSDIGIPATAFSADEGTGEVEFDVFAKAVNDNWPNTDYPSERLEAFVACGRRHGATHVYWA